MEKSRVVGLGSSFLYFCLILSYANLLFAKTCNYAPITKVENQSRIEKKNKLKEQILTNLPEEKSSKPSNNKKVIELMEQYLNIDGVKFSSVIKDTIQVIRILPDEGGHELNQLAHRVFTKYKAHIYYIPGAYSHFSFGPPAFISVGIETLIKFMPLDFKLSSIIKVASRPNILFGEIKIFNSDKNETEGDYQSLFDITSKNMEIKRVIEDILTNIKLKKTDKKFDYKAEVHNLEKLLNDYSKILDRVADGVMQASKNPTNEMSVSYGKDKITISILLPKNKDLRLFFTDIEDIYELIQYQDKVEHFVENRKKFKALVKSRLERIQLLIQYVKPQFNELNAEFQKIVVGSDQEFINKWENLLKLSNFQLCTN